MSGLTLRGMSGLSKSSWCTCTFQLFGTAVMNSSLPGLGATTEVYESFLSFSTELPLPLSTNSLGLKPIEIRVAEVPKMVTFVFGATLRRKRISGFFQNSSGSR